MATSDHGNVESHDQADRRTCLLIIPIPAAAHAVAPAALAGDQCRSLLADLAQLPDPRRRPVAAGMR
jgi:hypothetical protein